MKEVKKNRRKFENPKNDKKLPGERKEHEVDKKTEERLRIREMTKNSTSRRMPMRMRKIKKNWRKNENPRNDTESQFQETPRNLKETKENWRKIENPRNDKECDFQQNAKEIEGDREKQEKE